MELSNLILKIEKHYDFPQDIEWAVEGDNIYIVQSRAVTTLKKEKEEEQKIEGNVLLKGMSWEEAFADDWRKTKSWQPGWEYILS